MLVFDAI